MPIVPWNRSILSIWIDRIHSWTHQGNELAPGPRRVSENDPEHLASCVEGILLLRAQSASDWSNFLKQTPLFAFCAIFIRSQNNKQTKGEIQEITQTPRRCQQTGGINTFARYSLHPSDALSMNINIICSFIDTLISSTSDKMQAILCTWVR